MADKPKTISEGGDVSTYEAVKAATRPAAEGTIAGAVAAYQDGTMAPEDVSKFESAVKAGAIMLPRGVELKGAQTAPTGRKITLPAGVWQAYQSGKMEPADVATLERNIDSGAVNVPEGFQKRAAPAAPETTAAGVGGALSRAALPYLTGPVIGGVVGGLVAGPAGALAGSEAVAGAQTGLELLIPAINQVFGTKISTPAEATEALADLIGVARPKSAFERGLQSTAGMAGSAATQVQAARGLARAEAPALQAFGAEMAAQPVQQVVGAAAAGATSQLARELNLPEGAQLLAGLAGGVAGAMAVPHAPTTAQVAAEALRGRSAVPPVVAPEAVRAAVPTAEAQAATIERMMGERKAAPPPLPPEVAAERAASPAAPPPVAPEAPKPRPMWSEEEALRRGRMEDVTSRPAPGVAPEAPAAASKAAAEGAASKAPPAVAGAPEYAPTEQVTSLLRRVGTPGPDQQAAKLELAQLAKVNPDIVRAAERLGMEIPADIAADNWQVRSAAGLLRSEAGGAAEAKWKEFARSALTKFDDAMQRLGAAVTPYGADVETVGARVKGQLGSIRNELKNKATTLYNAVDAVVPKSADADMTATKDLLEKAMIERPQTMTSWEKDLRTKIDAGMTYEDLKSIKSEIGAMKRASARQQVLGSPDTRVLQQLETALAKDQIANVERLGSADAAEQLRSANLLTAQQKKLGETMQTVFGKHLEKTLTDIMSGAMKGVERGNSLAFENLSKALAPLPADMRREALATAIAHVTRMTGGEHRGAFSTGQFVKWVQTTRATSPKAYAEIMQALGPEAASLVDDIYKVSKAVAEAESKVLKTGKANQNLILDSMKAQGMLTRFMESALGKMVSAGVGAVVGGPAGAGAAPLVGEVLTRMKPDRIKVASEVLASDEFRELCVDAASHVQPTPAKVKAVAASPKFAKFASVTGIGNTLKQRETWLRAAMQGTKAAQRTEEQPTP